MSTPITLSDDELVALARKLYDNSGCTDRTRVKQLVDLLNEMRSVPIGTVRVDDHGNTAVKISDNDEDGEYWQIIRPNTYFDAEEYVTDEVVAEWHTVYKPKATQ